MRDTSGQAAWRNLLHYKKKLRISDKIDTNDSQGRPKLQHTASSQKVVREHLSTDPTLQHIYNCTIFTRSFFVDFIILLHFCLA